MSNIFISYAREDRSKAEQIAKAFEQLGWSVWWDRTIPAGKDFDTVIEEQLSKAKCIVVLWSTNSVTSRWVKAEAGEGADRDILIPVLIENVQVPLAFRQIQAADLVSWTPNVKSDLFDRLIADISAVLGLPLSQGDQDNNRLVNARETRHNLNGSPAGHVEEQKTTMTPDSIDQLLLDKIIARDKFFYGRLPNNKIGISDSAILEIRDQESPIFSVLRKTLKNVSELTPEMVERVIPSEEEYRHNQGLLKHVRNYKSDRGFILEARDGRQSLVDADYWKYITKKYPGASIYLTGPESQIVVEEQGEVRCVLMPLR